MRHNRLALLFILVAALAMLTIGAVALAQSSASFDLSWHTTGNGGGKSVSANYRVNGTIGQHIASHPVSGSASFQVSGGYWFAQVNQTIYLPLVLRN